MEILKIKTVDEVEGDPEEVAFIATVELKEKDINDLFQAVNDAAINAEDFKTTRDRVLLSESIREILILGARARRDRRDEMESERRKA